MRYSILSKIVNFILCIDKEHTVLDVLELAGTNDGAARQARVPRRQPYCREHRYRVSASKRTNIIT